jgi:hypothetical protein
MGETFFTPFKDGTMCDIEGCYREACSYCDGGCVRNCCPEHTVRLGEEESYCPDCNPRVRKSLIRSRI